MTFDENACGGMAGSEVVNVEAGTGWINFEPTTNKMSRNGFVLLSTGVTSAMRKEATDIAAAKVQAAVKKQQGRIPSFRSYADQIIGSLESRLAEEST